MRMPNLTIANRMYDGYDGSRLYSWNYSSEDLLKIQRLWAVLFATEYNWDLPEGTSPECVRSLQSTGLTSLEVRGLYTYKDGELANAPIFGASTNFNLSSTQALNDSALVVEKLSPLLDL